MIPYMLDWHVMAVPVAKALDKVRRLSHCKLQADPS
jgi:hypothetical protein